MILPRRLGWSIVVAVALAGCGAPDGTDAEGVPGDVDAVDGAANVREVPTLLVNEEAEGYFNALVHGVVGVNTQNCVSLDEYVLSAPAGSRVAADGTTVELTGYEPIRLGDSVPLGGGYEELTPQEAGDDLSRCAPAGAEEIRVVAVAPGRE